MSTDTSSYYSRPTTNPDFGSGNPQSPPSLLDPTQISPRRYDGDENTRDSFSDFNSIRLDGFDSDYDSSLAHRIGIGIASSASATYTNSAKTTNSSPNNGDNHGQPGGSSTNQNYNSPSGSQNYGSRKRTYSSASNSSGPASNGGDKGGGEKRTATKVCRVCGDKAFSYNFNVITCESCKAFFRRNANKEKEIRCPFNDNCDINIVSRRFCQRCRLAKCFRVGMKKEWIMSEEARMEKKQRILENRERRMAEKRLSDSKENGPLDHHKQGIIEQAAKLQALQGNLPGNNAMGTSLLPNQAAGVAQLAAAAAAAVGQLQTQLEPIQPPVTSSNFRPPIYTDVQHQSNSSLLAANEAAFAAAAAAATATPSFVTNTQQLANQVAQAQLAVVQAQQVAQVAQVAQVHPVVQAQAQQALQQAQLEHQLQQQAAQVQIQQQVQQAAQQVQQAAVAAQINAAVQHQQQQLATAIVAAAMAPQPSVQQQQQNAVAATLVAAAANAAVANATGAQATTVLTSSLPPPPPATSMLPLAPVVAPSLTQALPMDVTPATLGSVQPNQANSQDFITLPKDVVIKLFETKMEADAQNLQHGSQHPPIKCQCRCQCGRYPNDMLIVDKVMTDLLQTSSQQNNQPMDVQTSNLNEYKREMINVASVNNQTSAMGTSQIHAPVPAYKKEDVHSKQASLLEEEMDNVHDCALMTSIDQDHMAEILHANQAWNQELDPTDAQRHASSNPSKVDIVNMADGAIRRLVKMTKKIASFRTLDHHDQLILLKNTCMEYLIIRGAMSYNAKANVWNGPTPQSGYAVKMDSMKEMKEVALFENTIKFYATFREEWRTNENVMLVLGMIVLFNHETPGLHDPTPVAVQNRKYRSLLKRLLYTLCNQDAARTCREFKNLIDKQIPLRNLNQKAIQMIQEVDTNSMEPLVREMFVATAAGATSSSSTSPVEVQASMP